MARVFVYDGKEIKDHDESLTVAEIQQQLAGFYPDIANARVIERKRGDDDVYEFQKQVGVKGKGR